MIIVSGVSGSGKGAVLSVLKNYPRKFHFCISYTSRPPRSDDIPDETYHFISDEEFSEGIKRGEFIEWEEVHGYKYGRKRKDLDEAFKNGEIPVVEADVKGFKTFKKIYSNILSIFITPPSLEVAMERLKKRGSESREEVIKRIERYEMEMSFKKQYDHILINDELEKAQEELKKIINKRWQKNKSNVKKIRFLKILFLAIALFLLMGAGLAYAYFHTEIFKNESQALLENTTKDSVPEENLVIEQPPASEEAKQEIVQNPPKHENPKIQTRTASDGSKTTSVSTNGTVAESDLAKIATSSVSISSPIDIPFSDETSQYPYLSQVLKNYLNSTLKWKAEVSSLKEVIIRDAGDVGWTGQYLGQYRTDPTGKIISETGAIVLNVYYYKNSPYFQDYMRMTLAHEYGHHYTLYHKWLTWNLPLGTRFPDSYYQMRPLDKTRTAPDYSLGWEKCDLEIIAEDYSYFYSGYKYHALSDIYGFPSYATKTWLDKIGDSFLLSAVPTVDNPPTIEIVSPGNNQKLSGAIEFKVNASDDNGIQKVSYFINDNKIGESVSSPYTIGIDTRNYENGDYTLKAIASDGSQTSEKSVLVTFGNVVIDTTNPTITVIKPETDPYIWDKGPLDIVLALKDNVKIFKVNVYLDSEKDPIHVWEATDNLKEVNLTLSIPNASKGTYNFRFEVIDSSSNKGEATLAVEKK